MHDMQCMLHDACVHHSHQQLARPIHSNQLTHQVIDLHIPKQLLECNALPSISFLILILKQPQRQVDCSHLSPALRTLQGSPIEGPVADELQQAQHTKGVPAAQLCHQPHNASLKLVCEILNTDAAGVIPQGQ